MARRRSKEKQPSREDYRLKEKLKIEERVFDTRSMLRLGKLFNSGIISSMEFIIAKGKEADVYLADAGSRIGDGFVALKIFRLETSNFRNRMTYMQGDPRFGKVKNTISGIVNEWCKKEYSNLAIADTAGVHAPRPYAFSGNVLAMEFIGTEGKPAGMLRDTELREPGRTLAQILDQAGMLLAHGLVHADLSEYNVLMKQDVPYLIDFGQAVSVEHPSASLFLKRDIHNIVAYFNKRYGTGTDAESALSAVRKSGAGNST